MRDKAKGLDGKRIKTGPQAPRQGGRRHGGRHESPLLFMRPHAPAKRTEPLNGAAVANGPEQLAGQGDVCGDERAAVDRALDPELSVEDGKPVCQPEEPAPFG